MPTSATGSKPRETGFTLVELMVVITIIGLATSAVVLALPDDRRRVRVEAEALAARLAAARDLAITGAADVSVTMAERTYGFRQRTPAGWQATGRALPDRQLPAGITAATEGPTGGIITFDSTGLATPAQVVLRREDAQAVVAVDMAGGVHVRR